MYEAILHDALRFISAAEYIARRTNLVIAIKLRDEIRIASEMNWWNGRDDLLHRPSHWFLKRRMLRDCRFGDILFDPFPDGVVPVSESPLVLAMARGLFDATSFLIDYVAYKREDFGFYDDPFELTQKGTFNNGAQSVIVYETRPIRCFLDLAIFSGYEIFKFIAGHALFKTHLTQDVVNEHGVRQFRVSPFDWQTALVLLDLVNEWKPELRGRFEVIIPFANVADIPEDLNEDTTIFFNNEYEGVSTALMTEIKIKNFRDVAANFPVAGHNVKERYVLVNNVTQFVEIP